MKYGEWLESVLSLPHSIFVSIEKKQATQSRAVSLLIMIHRRRTWNRHATGHGNTRAQIRSFAHLSQAPQSHRPHPSVAHPPPSSSRFDYCLNDAIPFHQC